MENQAENIELEMTVSLRELITGVTRVAAIQRRILCKYCAGKTCKKCNGNGTVIETCNVNVVVPIGSRSLDIIRIEGEGNQSPLRLPGDIVIAIIMEENGFYDVEGNDIILRRTQLISLLDADLRHFTLVLPAGIRNEPIQIFDQTRSNEETLTYEYEIAVRGLGMPIGNTGNKGNLFIKIKIARVNWGNLWILAERVKGLLRIVNTPVPIDAIDGLLETST